MKYSKIFSVWEELQYNVENNLILFHFDLMLFQSMPVLRISDHLAITFLIIIVITFPCSYMLIFCEDFDPDHSCGVKVLSYMYLAYVQSYVTPLLKLVSHLYLYLDLEVV